MSPRKPWMEILLENGMVKKMVLARFHWKWSQSRAREGCSTSPDRVVHLISSSTELPSPSNTGFDDSEEDTANSNSTSDAYAALRSFRDVPSAEKQNLFIMKLNLCCVVFDFTDSGKNSEEEEIKRATLVELVDYIASANTEFSRADMQEVTKMVSTNLFRTLPNDSEDEESVTDPAWPHLQIVYELFLKFLQSPETESKTARRYVDQRFLLRLLDLFDSRDPREREQLKVTLHCIYGKFMPHRRFMRKAISNIFHRFVYETERHNGIAELLEVLGSIISGFALPIKDEHKAFLARALLPLHKPTRVAAYHKELSYCVTQYVRKDSDLAVVAVKGLLRYWPLADFSSKEVMLLGELEGILDVSPLAHFDKCVIPLFRRIARCLRSSCQEVVERTLLLWENAHFNSVVEQHFDEIFPIVFHALVENTGSHKHPSVRGLAWQVLGVLHDRDPELFTVFLKEFGGGGASTVQK